MAPHHREDFTFLSSNYMASFTTEKEVVKTALNSMVSTAPEDNMSSKTPSLSPEPQANHGFKVDDLSSDSDLSDVPEDLGPDPFTSPLPSPSVGSNLEYGKDLDELRTLLACAKKALLTSSLTRQVETTAELSLFMSNLENKWPGSALGGSTTLDDNPFSLDEDPSSSTTEPKTEYICPYTTTYHCPITFSTSTAAIIHSTVHTATSGEYRCPHARHHQCNKTFTTLSGARQHGDTVHLGLKRFPCPYAVEYNCTKSFSQSQSAKVHGYIHTGEKPYPCPYATEYGCAKAFTQSHSAKEHGYVHTGEKPHPCPYAEEYDCTRAFSQLHSAKEHGRTHVGG